MATGLQLSHASVFQDAINNGLQDFVLPSSLVATAAAGTPATGYFYSPIVGRSAIENISNNLRASLGVERIHTRIGYEVFSESGPLSERVWAMPDEKRIRFIGEWTFAYDSAREYRAKAGSASSAAPCYIEVLFYGTGLNLLISADSYSRAGITCSIDQGVYGSDLFTYISAQPMTSTGKNYAANQILNISSGLTLGIHSVIIKLSSPQEIYGLEILNQQTSNIVVNSGTAFINGLKVLSTGGTLSYKAGVTGTKGGRQLVYLNSDGTLGSSFRAVDTNTKYLTNANHDNEEIVKTYLPREFGSPNSIASLTDFTYNGVTAAAQAYTLSDGLTTLNTSSSSVSSPSTGFPEGISISSLSNWIEFTFVGTGIDLVNFTGNGTANADVHTIQIDDSLVTIGNLPQSSNPICTKIASGLPYGTHVLKITRSTAMASQSVTTTNASTTVTTASTATICVGASITGTGIPAGAKVSSITNATTFVISAAATAAGTVTATFNAPCYISAFKVYQPKKPPLSNDVMELADYNVLADYVPNATANEVNISSGVIRKTSIREAIYHSGVIHTALTNTTNGSTTITLAASTTKISANCPIVGPGIPAGAYVVSGSGTTYVISSAATATATGVTTSFYNPASSALWSTASGSGTSVSGYSVQSATGSGIGAQCTFYFFGTGLEVRFYQSSLSSSIFSIDGSSNFTTMANGSGGTGITTSFYGPGSASTITQSVTTTNASTTVTTGSTSNITVGASITGTGIPAGAKVSSVTSSTAFVISAAATAAGTVTATLTTPFTFTPSTGTLVNDSGTYSCGISFSNLPLGLHYITIYKNTATQLNIESFDVITPTYSPKTESVYVPNNNYLIGSNSISDSRNNSLISSKTNETIVAQSMDVQTSTTSSVFVPIVGASVIVNSVNGGWYRVHWNATCSLSSGANGACWFRVMVDGQLTQHSPYSNILPSSPEIADILIQAGSASIMPVSVDKMIYLGPGTHLIQMHWRSATTATCQSNTLNVVKEV